MSILDNVKIIIYFFLFISLFLILFNLFLKTIHIILNNLPDDIQKDILKNTINLDTNEIVNMYFLSKLGFFTILNTSIVLSCNIFKRFLTLYVDKNIKKKIFKN
jgi:magnesium-transporting ATPase (P-type)